MIRCVLGLALIYTSGAVFEAGSFEGVIWAGGFEKGSVRSEYNEIVGKPPAGRTAIVQSGGGLKPRCGKNFLHVKLDGSDTAYNHNRVEIGFHPTEQVPEKMDGTTRYYGWSFAHDKSKPVSSDSTYELFYWECFNIWQQTVGFKMRGNTLTLRTRRNGPDKDIGSWQMPPGKWHDFVMGIGWSPDGNKGWVQLWMDGKEVVQKTKHATMAWNQKSFSHLGLFRIPRVQTEVWGYYDCVVYAKGYTPGQSKGCYNDGPKPVDCKDSGRPERPPERPPNGPPKDGRRRGGGSPPTRRRKGGGSPPTRRRKGGGSPPTRRRKGGGSPPTRRRKGGGSPPSRRRGGGSPPNRRRKGGGSPPSRRRGGGSPPSRRRSEKRRRR